MFVDRGRVYWKASKSVPQLAVTLGDTNTRRDEKLYAKVR